MTDIEFEIELAKRLGCNRSKTSEIIEAISDTFTSILANGDTIRLPVFGKFEPELHSDAISSSKNYTVTFSPTHTIKGRLKKLLR